MEKILIIKRTIILLSLVCLFILSGCTTDESVELSVFEKSLNNFLGNSFSDNIITFLISDAKYKQNEFMFDEQIPYRLGATISGKSEIEQACLNYGAASIKKVVFTVKTGTSYDALECQSVLSGNAINWNDTDKFRINHEIDKTKYSPQDPFSSLIVKIESVL